MEKQLLKVPATITKVTTMSDEGLRLQVDTQSIGAEDSALIMNLYNKLGWFVFADQPPTADDCKDMPEIVLEEGEKQPSQRLRATLFVYWEQKKIPEAFDLFYRRKMNEFINIIKDKLT